MEIEGEAAVDIEEVGVVTAVEMEVGEVEVEVGVPIIQMSR